MPKMLTMKTSAEDQELLKALHSLLGTDVTAMVVRVALRRMQRSARKLVAKHGLKRAQNLLRRDLAALEVERRARTRTALASV